jgi:hypothetical protein
MRKLGEQLKALRTAARKVELDNELPVATFLCTYLPALSEFMDRSRPLPQVASPRRGHTGFC